MASAYLQAARTYARRSTLVMLALWLGLVGLGLVGRPVPRPNLVFYLLTLLALMSAGFLGEHLAAEIARGRAQLLPGVERPHLVAAAGCWLAVYLAIPAVLVHLPGCDLALADVVPPMMFIGVCALWVTRVSPALLMGLALPLPWLCFELGMHRLTALRGYDGRLELALALLLLVAFGGRLLRRRELTSRERCAGSLVARLLGRPSVALLRGPVPSRTAARVRHYLLGLGSRRWRLAGLATVALYLGGLVGALLARSAGVGELGPAFGLAALLYAPVCALAAIARRQPLVGYEAARLLDRRTFVRVTFLAAARLTAELALGAAFVFVVLAGPDLRRQGTSLEARSTCLGLLLALDVALLGGGLLALPFARAGRTLRWSRIGRLLGLALIPGLVPIWLFLFWPRLPPATHLALVAASLLVGLGLVGLAYRRWCEADWTA